MHTVISRYNKIFFFEVQCVPNRNACTFNQIIQSLSAADHAFYEGHSAENIQAYTEVEKMGEEGKARRAGKVPLSMPLRRRVNMRREQRQCSEATYGVSLYVVNSIETYSTKIYSFIIFNSQ